MSPISKSPTTKVTRSIPRGRIYITATFNNTIVSITDEKGNVVCWASTGGSGFSGSRKSSPYAATVTVENAINKAKSYGMHEMELFLKGPGPGRDAALRVLRAQKIHVPMIADLTPVPHNGTKPRKQKHNR
ncbi:30S ribosomal protein S11 [Patescibacteria group bacterium]|nr:30S ribosomal protein S11 [Patescibacteria group bacterium]